MPPIKKSKNQLWEERYRPQKLSQVIMPSRIRNILDGFMREQTAPNIIFHSRASGTGKTSTALAYAATLGAELLFVKAAENNTKSTVSDTISGFSQTMSLDGKPNIIILDEADGPGGAAFQAALKTAIEAASFSTRFMITCNSLEAISGALRSRCKPVSMDRTPEDDLEIRQQIFDRLCVIAKHECEPVGGDFSKDTINQIMEKNWPDMRSMLSDMQFNFMANAGSIIGNAAQDSSSIIPEIMSHLKAGKLQGARKVYIEKATDPVKFHFDFAEWCFENLDEKYHAAIAVQIGESARWHTMSVSDELNVACGLFGKVIEILRA